MVCIGFALSPAWYNFRLLKGMYKVCRVHCWCCAIHTVILSFSRREAKTQFRLRAVFLELRYDIKYSTFARDLTLTGEAYFMGHIGSNHADFTDVEQKRVLFHNDK